jgi:hypothetical protein
LAKPYPPKAQKNNRKIVALKAMTKVFLTIPRMSYCSCKYTYAFRLEFGEMIMGGMANISSAGFKDVLTIQINGMIMKTDTPISSP